MIASLVALRAANMRVRPQATVVSIGHRSTLDAFHTRKVALVEDGEIHVLGKAGEPARTEPTTAR
nr:hypothetical protein [Bradyrhizobium symbiodeficiens]QIP04316.1 hypothetical protein HAU86_00005 [Bradyrhizobium symbiodeficiens]